MKRLAKSISFASVLAVAGALLFWTNLGAETTTSSAGELFGKLDVESDETLSREEFERRYPWTYDATPWPKATTLQRAFDAPDGFERVDLEGGSFGEFLRELPVRLDRRTVHAFDGSTVRAPAAAIVMLPLGDRNLQQCADSVLRLRAEYLWARGAENRIEFHFTSGDASAWPAWKGGERFEISGSTVERHDGPPRPEGRGTFRAYLSHLFTYAGTRSLPMDARRLDPDTETQPGDFFLESGSPGHVVMVLDVAEASDGRRAALLAQGFMPAQEFHLIEGTGPRVLDGVWYVLPDDSDGRLETPSWEAFERNQRWRFP